MTLRKQFAEAARDVDKMFQTEDFVVPLDKIPEITKQIPELRENTTSTASRLLTSAMVTSTSCL